MIKWNDEHTYGWNKIIDNIYYYIDFESKNFALFLLKLCILIPLMCFVGILAILQTIDWGVHLYTHMVDKQLKKSPSNIIKEIGEGLLVMTSLPMIIYSLPAHAISRIKNLFKKKKREPIYEDDDYLVQDWRGFVISQGEHRRQWGFGGYPATHDTDCTCIRCQMATANYRINTGYIMHSEMWTDDYNPTRRQVFSYLSRQTFDYPWVKKEEGFLPKKKIKAHKIVERKYTIRRPGVYTREVDYSTMDLRTVRRDRDE